MEKIPSIDEARDKAGEALETAKGAVQERLGVAKEKIEAIKEGPGGQIRDRASQAQTVAKERYGQTVDQLKGGYTKVRKDFDQLSGDVNEYVRDNPGRSIAVAAGIGFFVGILLRGGGRHNG